MAVPAAWCVDQPFRRSSGSLAKFAAIRGPLGRRINDLQGGARSSLRPDTVQDNRCDDEAHKGRMQTGRRTAHGASLSC